jgi:hypothetical protein
LDVSPRPGLPGFPVKGRQAKAYPLSWDEQHRLLELLPRHLADAALFGINTGCREQEICRLRWDWKLQVLELDTSVLVLPAPICKASAERVVALNSVAPNGDLTTHYSPAEIDELPRKLNDFLGDLFEVGGHQQLLRKRKMARPGRDFELRIGNIGRVEYLLHAEMICRETSVLFFIITRSVSELALFSKL